MLISQNGIWEIKTGSSGNIDGTDTQIVIMKLCVQYAFYSEHLQALYKPNKLRLIQQ